MYSRGKTLTWRAAFDIIKSKLRMGGALRPYPLSLSKSDILGHLEKYKTAGGHVHFYLTVHASF